MERLSMRKIKEVLRLHYQAGFSDRRIATNVSVSRATVAAYLQRFEHSQLQWPLPDDLADTELEQQLFPSTHQMAAGQCRPTPDWHHFHQELRQHAHTTLFLLWQEYKEQYPHGYQYSWFCDQYRAWKAKLDVSMRQNHRVGEKLFVDYAGQTLPITDPSTGQIRHAEIFVAVLGASSYTYAEATWSQQLADWIGSHVRTFKFLGGVPKMVVPDNLKSGVTKAHRYEPDLNPTYADLACHYGIAVEPARVRHPKDKSKAEGGVLLVERWILAVLRHRTFFSLHEANQAIAEQVHKLNQRPFKKLPGSRQEQFDTLDKPALQALPTQAYEFAQWKKARVNIDYHLEVDKHYYSVPYKLVKQQLDVRYSAYTVECFHKSVRVASHLRSPYKGQHSTLVEHMPKAHREYAHWTPQRLLDWAQKSGPITAELIELIMYRRHYPQQGLRSCLGIMRLGKSYGYDRLEAACERALRLGAHSYKSIESILRQGLDQRPLADPKQAPDGIVKHDNIRGASYYH